MEKMMATQPRREQIAALLENDKGEPIRMLNLLKFREFAQYSDGTDTGLSGAEAYQRYAAEVVPIIRKAGGEIVFSGQANTLVIGDGELEWDMVSIAEYPSVTAFLGMTSSDEYQKIHIHRDAGLEHQLLVEC
ncbi:MAG: DUF1330 domain-containing protein [Haliea sp.]|jgi:uncharacterized protein (DUF1330 family)|nr:DUF1330 domain-containing protein [Haliea sp.]